MVGQGVQKWERWRPAVADDIVTSLRLLSHPFLGAAGISATERNDLREAAATIERLQNLATELAEALEAIIDNPGEYGQAFTALSHWHHRTCCPATPAD